MNKITLILLYAFILFSCKNVHLDDGLEKTIFIDTQSIVEENDEICEILNSKIDRDIVIIENHLTDTILIGFTVLPPKQTGSIYYSKFKDKNDKIVALYNSNENPPLEKICFSKYNNKESKGTLKFTFKLNQRN